MGDQRFHHFSRWEDYPAGLYVRTASPEHVQAARAILASPELCEAAMRRVVRSWPVSTEQNLTDRSQNRRAWLGQAACCIETGASAASTKQGWWQLTEDQQTRANRIADAVISDWELTLIMDGWS
jgi:hypothetical protein